MEPILVGPIYRPPNNQHVSPKQRTISFQEIESSNPTIGIFRGSIRFVFPELTKACLQK